MSDKDVDAQFADIVAHWDDAAPLPERPEQTVDESQSDLAPDDPRPSRPGVNPPLEPQGNPTNPPPTRPFVVWRGAVEPEPDEDDGGPAELEDLDDDEHFEPGPLAPLPPQEDLQFWGIIVGLVAGPLLLLWLVLFRPDVSDWWTLGALGLTVGGFVLLVLRQPHDRDEDDPDNGARV
jgi:hypothetical protein